MKQFKFATIVLVTVMACANQGFPPGGPEDKSPPQVLRSFPPADSTHVPRDVHVQIIFNEAVVPRTVEESFFITPFSGDKARFRWRNDRVLTVTFADSLLADRTYVVTIGSGAKDRRNNMMKESYTLAFSTGATLDRGEIRGVVYGETTAGAQVWAYDLNETPDPNPAERSPLYITQAGKDGGYRLTNLALGAYRLFAVMDRNVNNRYDAEFDLLGVCPRDVRLDSSALRDEPLNFRIALRDTTAPRLEAASAPDNRHVDLRFSEPMQPERMTDVANFVAFSAADTLTIENASVDLFNRSMVHLATFAQTAGLEYTVIVHQGTDRSGLPLGQANRAVFTGSAVPDTVKPRYLAMMPKDSSKFVPPNAPLTFHFSKAMQPATISRMTVADTLGDTVRGTVTWRDKTQFVFTPQSSYKKETFYLVTLPVDSVFDLAGNALADTLFRRQFTTVNPDTLSAISGTLRDADSTATGPFVLKAKSVKQKEPMIYDLKVEREGRFAFDAIMPGNYIIELFRDRDGDGAFSWGEAFPYQPAERFYAFPDTIEIRSRWPSDGEEIVLPR